MELQDFSAKKLMEKLQRRLRELHFNTENKLNQNAVVDWVFSGDHDRMNEMAFGEAAKDINFSKNADNSGLRRVGEIEQYTLAAYDFACEKFGEENVMGAFAHLDETTVHIHLPVIPVAKRKARGKKTAVYVNVENPDLKIMSKEYRNLSSAKRKEWVRKEEVEKEMSERVSYSGLVGENKEERSKWLVDFHTEFYEKVGKKYGLERGESWEELAEEERKNRRWKSSRQLENERRQLEKEVEKLENKAEELMAEISNMEKQVGIGAQLANIFGVGKLADIHRQLKEAIKVAKEALTNKEKAEEAMKKAQQAEKIAKEALRETKEAHTKELQAERERNRQRGISDANKIAELLMEVKSMKSKPDPLAEVSGFLSHLGVPRLTTKNMEEAMAIAKASPFRVMLAGERERQQMCNSILEWGFQRKRVLEGERTPAAIALLQKLWQAMKDVWQRILNSLQEMRAPMSPGEAAEFLQKFPNVQLTSKAAMADIEQQLRFTPGTAAIVEGWQNAMQQTETQFMGQFRSERTTKQVQQHEQADTSLDVEQEQTRTAAHHR